MGLFPSAVFSFMCMCVPSHASGHTHGAQYSGTVPPRASEAKFGTTCWSESSHVSSFKNAIANPDAKVDWNKYSSDILSKDSFTTEDGKTIHGLVWRAKEPMGYLLVAQGTSMLAAEIFGSFKRFSDLGLDVYIYDFRGYGENSNIKTTFEGIISDYSVRLSELNKIEKYKQHYIYGISFGGVLFSNAIDGLHDDIDGVVFDSVPDKITFLAFCPWKMDPTKLLPKTCKNWLIVGAERDGVVGKGASKLAKKAKVRCGAQTKIEERYGHVFMDNHSTERLNAAKSHFGTLVRNNAER